MTSTYSKYIYRLLSSVIVGTFFLAASQSSAEEKGGVITVSNKSSNPIWVTITSQKPNVTESSDSSSIEDSSKTSVGGKTATSANIAGIGGISNEHSLNVDHSQTHKESGSQSRKIDWSPFIDAGEAKMAPGESEDFKVNDSTYYLTVRRTEDTVWRLNVPKETKSANKLTIDDNGYWDPIGEVIQNGDNVTLSWDNSKYHLSKPVDAHVWNSIANGSQTAVTHVIENVEMVQGVGEPIPNEAVVRFKIAKPKYPGYEYLLHGIDNNLFYDNEPDSKASHWTVRMLDRQPELRSGMKVQIQGIRWDGYITLVHADGMQWAKALPENAAGETIWTINKDVPPDPMRN